MTNPVIRPENEIYIPELIATTDPGIVFDNITVAESESELEPFPAITFGRNRWNYHIPEIAARNNSFMEAPPTPNLETNGGLPRLFSSHTWQAGRIRWPESGEWILKPEERKTKKSDPEWEKKVSDYEAWLEDENNED